MAGWPAKGAVGAADAASMGPRALICCGRRIDVVDWRCGGVGSRPAIGADPDATGKRADAAGTFRLRQDDDPAVHCRA